MDQQNTGVSVGAADPAVVDKMDSQPAQESRMVPLDALEAEREQRQKLQEEVRVMKDHMSLMQASQNRPPPKDEYDGLRDDDVLTVGEYKKLMNQKERQYSMTIDELRMTQKYPDYQDVIAKHLPDVIKTNPGLKRNLEQTQDYELAYYLAKNSDSFKTANKSKKKSDEAERILQNTQQAGSLSSMGAPTPINTAQRYKSMSDTDFAAEVQKNLGYL